MSFYGASGRLGDVPEALELFHPLIREWFSARLGVPTDIQARAWPEIAAGGHLLISAPTGSGKTLTAFLWALQQLLCGSWEPGRTQVLYVSPLKALNSDIRRNLEQPLAEIRKLFEREGLPCPCPLVLTRSGDTPGQERQRMLRRPPEVLITTPESLNLMLSAPRARGLFTALKLVILDEIHALAVDKRGTHLITAVERLVPLCGEFQRIGLSATIKPLPRIAAFLGGFRRERRGGRTVYLERPVKVLQSSQAKRFELQVYSARAEGEPGQDGSRWTALAGELEGIIRRNRTTLIFTNARRLAEKLSLLLNEALAPRYRVYAHHGSLSKEVRAVAESRLKEGKLAAIVATSSLELGIDIGSLDEVILVQTPPSVSSGLQRLGRAGHAVGEVSRGALYSTHGLDLLDAAVMARCLMERDLEEARPVSCPLDVLAQIIVSMTGVEEWDLDELYGFIRASYPYRDLSRRQFDLVVQMLEGRYAGSRLRELQPRVSIDRLENRIRARQGALSLVYRSGGTIPDRGYYDLRLRDTQSKIGELDEEFVWERKLGDTFGMGTQSWEIVGIDHQKVEVVPWQGGLVTSVFWRAEQVLRDFSFCQKIGVFLEAWNDRLNSGEFLQELRSRYFLSAGAAGELAGFLSRQREATRTPLPHRHHLLVEHITGPLAQPGVRQVFLHTLWGGRVNLPLAYALSAAWEEGVLSVFADDEGILLLLPEGGDVSRLLAAVKPGNLEGLLRRNLERSGFFGARFRENAGRALLLPRAGFGRRVPRWFNRLRAKKLLETALDCEDFPVLVETWRACLNDEFDLPSLKNLLEELQAGVIRAGETLTRSPSPFASGLAWKQTGVLMYAGDEASSGRASRLAGEVLKEVLASSQLRPRIFPGLIREFEEKVQRTAVGYAPRSARELFDWVKERILIPLPEWKGLLEAVERDHGLAGEEILAALSSKLAVLILPGERLPGVAALESLPRLLRALSLGPGQVRLLPLEEGRQGREVACLMKKEIKTDADTEEGETLVQLAAEWLRFYGPRRENLLAGVFGLGGAELERLLAELVESGLIFRDALALEQGVEICEAENLEILLRMQRARRRPAFKALSADLLPLFLARYQGLAGCGQESVQAREEGLQGVLERLFGYPAPCFLWEQDFFPARLPGYRKSWLDRLFQDSELQWFGCGRGRVSFCLRTDYELFAGFSSRQGPAPELEALIPEPRGKYGYWELQEHSGYGGERLVDSLWRQVWQGRLANDTYEVVRRGLATGFKTEQAGVEPSARRGRRMSFDRWRSGRPLAGSWFCLDPGPGPEDPLEQEELDKDRARQLLQRYGLLARELLEGELPPLRWSGVFRALRLMELSGEVLCGHFFRGLAGLQFISPQAFQLLEEGLPEEAVYWLCAADPASACGLRREDNGNKLPHRLPTTHLVFQGSRLILISRRKGRELDIRLGPEDPLLPRALALFQDLPQRDCEPWKAIRVERVNGLAAPRSPYTEALCACGFQREYRELVLRAGV